MSDNSTSPADTDKIVEALVELTKQTRESKTLLSDVMAQRTEFAAQVKDLKASIDTTRRALDPEQLGAHVADNIEELMGQSVQAFAKGIQLNHDAATANIGAARDTAATTKDLANKLAILDQESRALTSITSKLEQRDHRSKWDWVTLAAAMAVAAALAGGGAFFYAKANIERNDFNRSVQLIAQDDDASWCGFANAPIIQDRNGTSYCAIKMPRYQVPEEPAQGGE